MKKEKLVAVLKTNVKLWNRYVKFCLNIDFSFRINLRYANLSNANLRYANLSNANLRSANLSNADLRSADLMSSDLRSADLISADLRYANLRYADMSNADLSNANLRYANLSNANLRYANLSNANLDFSSMPLWCGDLKANYDDKQIIQQLYHVFSHLKNSNNCSDELKQLLSEENVKIANKFHRVDECGKL